MESFIRESRKPIFLKDFFSADDSPKTKSQRSQSQHQEQEVEKDEDRLEKLAANSLHLLADVWEAVDVDVGKQSTRYLGSSW